MKGIRCAPATRTLEEGLRRLQNQAPELVRDLRRMDPVDDKEDMLFAIREVELSARTTKYLCDIVEKVSKQCAKDY